MNRRLDPLLDLLQNLKGIKNKNVEREMMRYVFICLIACLEGYLKLVIKDLIDKSEKCRENVEKLNDIKFDINTVLAIHGKTVSIGEFVSHLVPLSSFESINKNMGVITGADFIGELLGMEVEYKNGEKRKCFLIHQNG